MNITNVIIGFCSLMFFMVAADKFSPFLDPPCSLAGYIPPLAWKTLGALQLAAGILIWLPKYRKHVAGFFMIFMLIFTIIHLLKGTQDVGGSALMGVLLGLLVWNPSFLNRKK